MPALSELIPLVVLGARYWFGLAHQARRELRAWHHLASHIPDSTLRAHALSKLESEHLSAEGAALFAALAPGRWRRHVVALSVAFEVLFDLLDGLGEVSVLNTRANNFRLHDALLAAVEPRAPLEDFLALHERQADGGYITSLVQRCQMSFAALPAARIVQPFVTAAADRCRHGQSLLHSSPPGSARPLLDWVETQPWRAARGLSPHELAAATISPLALHALFAAAADPSIRQDDAAAVDHAYFPAVCALTILFDGLVDADQDHDTDNYSFIDVAAHHTGHVNQLPRLVRECRTALRTLPNRHLHDVLLAGIIAFYLSTPAANGRATMLSADILQDAHTATKPMLVALRLRRLV